MPSSPQPPGRLLPRLLSVFVRGDWVEQLDYSSLGKVDPSYVGRGLAVRSNDLVWRVKWGERYVYIYLMLEFQSTVDPYMAARMLTYVGLLYEGLIRTKQLSERGRLPPLLPIVLYNGSALWRAEQEMMALIEPVPAALEPYRPQLRYLLIDEARCDEGELSAMRNFVASMFRLEHSSTSEEIAAVLVTLRDQFRGTQYENLQRDYIDWARGTILKKVPDIPADKIDDFLEMQTMLDDLTIGWKAGWKAEGVVEGIRKGKATLLLRLMRLRFGEIPNEFNARVESTSEEQMDVLTDRLLNAPNIDALFDDLN